MHGIRQHPALVYISAVILSIVLSFWQSLTQVVINSDAICYLQSAQSVPQGLNYVMHLCDQAKWPFYSILIFYTASITKFSYLNAAYFLNAIFSLISVLAFIGIVQFLKYSTRTLWFALLIILLSHEFNSVREYIVRDHGYFAFYLLSILLLLNFFRNFRFETAIVWSASLIVATLFRLEGLFFLIVLPFVALFHGPVSDRIKSFLKLNTLTILGLIIVAIWFAQHPQQRIEQMGRLDEFKLQFVHGIQLISTNFTTNAQALAQHVMSQYSAHDAALVLAIVLVVWYFTQVVRNVSLIYAILVVYAWMERILKPERPGRLILWFYVLVNVVVTGIFFVEAMYLSKRYLLALSLTLMIWVPFALDYLCEQWGKRKWPLVLAVLFIVLSSLGGIFDFGYSKRFIRDAGLWVEQTIPMGARFYTNDYQVMYYSQHFGNDIFPKAREFAQINLMTSDQLKQYDYVALRVDKKEEDKYATVVKELGTPVQQFADKRGDQILIYKVGAL